MVLPYPLILASQSPRRQELLTQAGFRFKTITHGVSEDFPEGLTPVEAALYIASQKMEAFHDLTQKNVVLCADTIVVQNQLILGKPGNKEEAFTMLQSLSGNSHEVITGVVIRGPDNKTRSFAEVTRVEFVNLDEEEIHSYIENFQPFDKAGSYGIQEWIGLIGIREIHGSYFNVVGLPIHRVYQELKSLFP